MNTHFVGPAAIMMVYHTCWLTVTKWSSVKDTLEFGDVHQLQDGKMGPWRRSIFHDG